MEKKKYSWTDNPTVAGVSKCDTDILNDCLMHLKYESSGGGDSLPLFWKQSFDHILAGEEAKGWAIQGSLVTMTYPGAVNKILEDFNNGEAFESYRLDGVTNTGCTINSEFVVTGGEGKHLKLNETAPLGVAKTWEVQTAYTHNTHSPYNCVFGSSGADFNVPTIITVEGKFNVYLSSTGTSWDIAAASTSLTPIVGTKYYLKFGYDGTKYYLRYNTDGGENYTDIFLLNSTVKVKCAYPFMLLNLGINVTTYASTGSIDLKKTKVITDGEVWWQLYHWEYKKAANGRKIVDIKFKDEVDELFRSNGYNPYYVLDSFNKCFYLPKTKWLSQFTDDLNKVGDFVEAGLPNIKGKIGTPSNWLGGCSEAFYSLGVGRYVDSGGNAQYSDYVAFDASRSNPIYGNSDTVQPPAVLHLIYYKVGDTFVNESEIDLANLTSDINILQADKAEKDLSNLPENIDYVVESYESGTSWYRVYKSGWIEQGGVMNTAQTVSFLKAFIDNNYVLITSSNTLSNYGGGIPLNQMGYTAKTKSNFTGYADVNLQKSWHAFGY